VDEVTITAIVRQTANVNPKTHNQSQLSVTNLIITALARVTVNASLNMPLMIIIQAKHEAGQQVHVQRTTITNIPLQMATDFRSITVGIIIIPTKSALRRRQGITVWHPA
tara:strand:- start:251 stop:580 length:330 start_codon:yes stop_codon:yes gene_type:complete